MTSGDDKWLAPRGVCVRARPLGGQRVLQAIRTPDPVDTLRSEAARTLRMNAKAHEFNARDCELGWPPSEHYQIVGRGPMRKLSAAEVAEMERLLLSIGNTDARMDHHE